jgi:hypothetical protein
MNEHHSVVAVYPTPTAIEAGIIALQESAFDLKKLSVVGRDYHTDEHGNGFYNMGDRMKVGGKARAFWGGVSSFVFGSALFWIPGVGPLVVAGPIVAWMLAASEAVKEAGGLSALGASLSSLGIPKNGVILFERELKAGKFLLLAHGSRDDVTRAREILARTQPDTLEQHASSPAERQLQTA